MATNKLKIVQRIPTRLENAWSFFSDPKNLSAITPPDMKFTILSNHINTKMYSGQIIEYKVRPLKFIPIYWMTEITHVQDMSLFVDEQRCGPYQLWHHQHHFSVIDGGIEMTDIVHYRLSLGLLGNLANRLFVKTKLRKIFEFRFNKIENLFGKWEGEEVKSIQFNNSVI